MKKRKLRGSLTVETSFLLLIALSMTLGMVLVVCYLRDVAYLRLYLQHRANAILSYVCDDEKEGHLDWDRWVEKDFYWRVMLGGELTAIGEQAEQEIETEVVKGLVFPQRVQIHAVINVEQVYLVCNCDYQFPAISELVPGLTNQVLHIAVVAKTTEQEEFLRMVQGIFHAVQEGKDDNNLSTGDGS